MRAFAFRGSRFLSHCRQRLWGQLGAHLGSLPVEAACSIKRFSFSSSSFAAASFLLIFFFVWFLVIVVVLIFLLVTHLPGRAVSQNSRARHGVEKVDCLSSHGWASGRPCRGSSVSDHRHKFWHLPESPHLGTPHFNFSSGLTTISPPLTLSPGPVAGFGEIRYLYLPPVAKCALQGVGISWSRGGPEQS